MQSRRVLIMLSLLLLLGLATVSRAQGVSTYMDVMRFDWDGHNDMLGIVSATTDYSVVVYYCGKVSVDLSREDSDGNEVDGSSASSARDCDSSYFHAETILQYVAGADYSVTGVPDLEAYYNQGNYYDPYDFAYYEELNMAGSPIWYPLSLYFSGGGSGGYVNYSQYLLGIVYAAFDGSAIAKAGPPHHLKVVGDSSSLQGTCNHRFRIVKYEIVDENGKKAGKVLHRERHQSYTGVECISNFVQPTESACYVQVTGGQVTYRTNNPFQDNLFNGCLLGDAAHCGFTIDKQKWNECRLSGAGPLNFNEYPLATLLTDVRSQEVKINGVTQFGNGTQLYP